MRILLISDIHGNFPALKAVAKAATPHRFDHIINCGDSLVYAPFANETLDWLREHNVISILGNTDKKVIKLLKGKTFKKPSKPEKRIMYDSCADDLTGPNREYLLGLKKKTTLSLSARENGKDQAKSIGIFHGSPADPDEFLFPDMPQQRFQELAEQYPYKLIVTGHSHTPYHITIRGTHFINPGSVGRMFDGNPSASWATITIDPAGLIRVQHHRTPYDIDQTINGLKANNLPSIYHEMYRKGLKLN